MKKYSYLIIIALISILVLAGCTLLSNIGQVPTTEQSGINYLTKHTSDAPYSKDLLAGQTIDVGEVLVWNDDENLYVEFVASGDWCITETHVHVFTDNLDFNDITLKNGNPPPGKFDYKDEHDCVADHTYEIPLNWSPDIELYIAAHAVVQNDSVPVDWDNGDPISWWTETAWGAGFDFPGANWATYFTYKVQQVLLGIGNWLIDVNHRESHFLHDMSITAQDASGALTGTGGYPAGSTSYDITWVLIDSSLTDSTVTLTLDYDGSSEYKATLVGTVVPDGNSMSGEWSSNTEQSGAWTATRVQ